jgi:uncharacterized RDD family membrane protein YckC
MVISWDKAQNSKDMSPAAPETIQDSIPPAEQPAAGVPGQQDQPGQDAAAMASDRPLGRRVAAALIDLGVLSGLFAILSLIVGETSPAVGSFRIFLHLFRITVNGQPVVSVGLYGAWAVLSLVLLPVYYFAGETAAGQTVGKALLGLRVLRKDGRRPSGGQIAGRTLFRLIDGLPVLYLAGFITVLATGRRRRQRLGDLAAGTIVTREQPARHRGLAAAAVILVILAVAGLSAYRAASPASPQAYQTYRAHRVSFSYPAGWQQETSTGGVQHGGAPLWRVTVGPGTASDGVAVEEYRLSHPIGAANLAAVAARMQRLVQGAARQVGDTIQAGLQPITVGGLPGLRFLTTGTVRDGSPVESTYIFVFNGATEYEISCQHTRPAAAAVTAACSRVIRTFTTAQPPPPAAAVATPTPEPSAAPVPRLSASRWLHGLRLLQTRMNDALSGTTGIVTRPKLFSLATQVHRCLPGLARLGPPVARLQPAHDAAAQACAQFEQAAKCYAGAGRAFDPYTTSAQFTKLLNCGDTDSSAGSSLIGEAVAVGSSR